jgi:hypothetical protein
VAAQALVVAPVAVAGERDKCSAVVEVLAEAVNVAAVAGAAGITTAAGATDVGLETTLCV